MKMRQKTKKLINLPIVSFKEVHEEIEKEHLLLHKDYDVKDFQEKATFLTNIGMSNSITTKLYKDISDSSGIIDKYRLKYNDRYKLILDSQLERICEKYNLYLRQLPFYMGDIPEKNIKDLKEFSVYFKDLALLNTLYETYLRNRQNVNILSRELSEQKLVEQLALEFSQLVKIPLNSNINGADINYDIDKFIISIEHFKALNLDRYLFIAAPKKMFTKDAFIESDSRILGRHQLEPKNQVVLDPIILFLTRHGYLIITAWGDEANDELIVNQNLN